MSTSDILLSEQKDHVLRLTLNRPDRRNAVNDDLILALTTAFAAASDDPTKDRQAYEAGHAFGAFQRDKAASSVGEWVALCSHGVPASLALELIASHGCIVLVERAGELAGAIASGDEIQVIAASGRHSGLGIASDQPLRSRAQPPLSSHSDAAASSASAIFNQSVSSSA